MRKKAGRVLFSIISLLLLIPITVSHAQDQSYCTQDGYGYSVHTNSSAYQQGSAINFCLLDNTRTPFFITTKEPWEITDANGNMVFTPAPVMVQDPQPQFVFYGTWDQVNMQHQQVMPGIYHIVFTGTPNNAFTTIQITNSTQAQSAYILLNQYSGYPGSTFYISGYQFLAHETVTISFSSVQVEAITTTEGSFISSPITIPFMQPGTYLVTVYAQTSHIARNASFTLLGYYPNAEPSSYYILPGQSIGYTGIHFAPNETISLLSSTHTIIAQAKADNNGNFSIDQAYTAPFSTANTTVTQEIEGNMTNTMITFSIKIGAYYPQLIPSSYYVKQNTAMSAYVTGFAPNEMVQLYVNNMFTTEALADNSGTVSFPEIITPSTGSSCTITAVGHASMTQNSKTIYLAP